MIRVGLLRLGQRLRFNWNDLEGEVEVTQVEGEVLATARDDSARRAIFLATCQAKEPVIWIDSLNRQYFSRSK